MDEFNNEALVELASILTNGNDDSIELLNAVLDVLIYIRDESYKMGYREGHENPHVYRKGLMPGQFIFKLCMN